MKLPYFLLNLKYNTVSFPLEEAEEELRHELTGLIKIKNNLIEMLKSYKIIEEHACKHKYDFNNMHLKKIEEDNKVIHYNLAKMYGEMELLNKGNVFTEEEFLAEEAEKKVINSPFFIALKHMINIKHQKFISEEEQWKYMDEQRDFICDFQENYLKELAAKLENSSPCEILHRFIPFIKKGLSEIDEGLAIIEHALEENKFSKAEKGLLKVREGFVKIKTVELRNDGDLL